MIYGFFHFFFRCLSSKKADELAGSDPDYATRDLYNAISSGDYPSYTMYIQVLLTSIF